MDAKKPVLDLPALPEAVAFLREGERFTLTSHVNCDGDGVGGCLALQGILRSMGKGAEVVFADPPGEQYRFLEGWEDIQQAVASPAGRAERLIVLDCPTLERIGDVQQCVDERTRILDIDHHKDSQLFGHVNLVAPQSSSSSELIYHLAVACGAALTPVIAEHLYLGILFDTGGFRYSLTTPTTLEVAAELVRIGARLDFVADRLFNNKSLAALKLMGRALDSLALHAGGQVAVLHLSQADLNAGDADEAVNFGLMIQSVEVSIALKEEQPGKYRVSLRSRQRVDVSRVAAAFGGGGHTRASGCRLAGTAATVSEALLKELGRYL